MILFEFLLPFLSDWLLEKEKKASNQAPNNERLLDGSTVQEEHEAPN